MFLSTAGLFVLALPFIFRGFRLGGDKHGQVEFVTFLPMDEIGPFILPSSSEKKEIDLALLSATLFLFYGFAAVCYVCRNTETTNRASETGAEVTNCMHIV